MSDQEAEARRERTAREQERDARATRLLVRVGIGAVVVLAVWFVVVLWAFVGH